MRRRRHHSTREEGGAKGRPLRCGAGVGLGSCKPLWRPQSAKAVGDVHLLERGVFYRHVVAGSLTAPRQRTQQQ